MKTILTLCLLTLGLNTYAAGYDTLAVEQCSKEANRSIQQTIDWENESEDWHLKSNYIAQTNTADVTVDDNGLSVELTVEVITYSLNENGDHRNSSFLFDAFYNSMTNECEIDFKESGYKQEWCSTNCIK